MTDTLKSLPLFADLDDKALEYLETNSEILDYVAGDTILAAPETAAFCIVLIDGHWSAAHETPDGQTRTAEAKTPGVWTGGLGLIAAAAPLTVTAKAECTVLEVPVDVMQALASKDATLARALLAGLKSLSALLHRARKSAKDST